jgi:hypothetical protein
LSGESRADFKLASSDLNSFSEGRRYPFGHGLLIPLAPYHKEKFMGFFQSIKPIIKLPIGL